MWLRMGVMSRARISCDSGAGLSAVSVDGLQCKKFHITANVGDDGDVLGLLGKVVDYTKAHHSKIYRQFVFGGSELADLCPDALEATCGPVTWPITWITGKGPAGPGMVGTQVMAMDDSMAPEPVQQDGRTIGFTYETDYAKFCILGDVRPVDTTASRREQAVETFDNLNRALASVGMSFTDVARTWFYLDEILEWYDVFNEVRTDFFNTHDVFNRVVPASTGIGAANAAGAALVSDLIAVVPKDERCKVFAVPSPLQCPALDYKSSFSRAVEVAMPDQRYLCVSGTASIAPDGRTEHVGNIDGQIDLTMRVVDAILESRSMDWEDTKQAVVYFANTEDVQAFRAYCARRSLPSFPMVLVHGDVCRDDLLFEIEVETVCAVSTG